jgi:hypothetical protein
VRTSPLFLSRLLGGASQLLHRRSSWRTFL